MISLIQTKKNKMVFKDKNVGIREVFGNVEVVVKFGYGLDEPILITPQGKDCEERGFLPWKGNILVVPEYTRLVNIPNDMVSEKDDFVIDECIFNELVLAGVVTDDIILKQLLKEVPNLISKYLDREKVEELKREITAERVFKREAENLIVAMQEVMEEMEK